MHSCCYFQCLLAEDQTFVSQLQGNSVIIPDPVDSFLVCQDGKYFVFLLNFIIFPFHSFHHLSSHRVICYRKISKILNLVVRYLAMKAEYTFKIKILNFNKNFIMTLIIFPFNQAKIRENNFIYTSIETVIQSIILICKLQIDNIWHFNSE